MSLKSSLKKLVRKTGLGLVIGGLSSAKKIIRKEPEIAKLAGGLLTMTPLAPVGVALTTAAQLSELSGKTVPQQQALAALQQDAAQYTSTIPTGEVETRIMPSESELTNAAAKAAVNVAGSAIPSDRDASLVGSYDSGAVAIAPRRFEPTLRAAFAAPRSTPRRKSRRKTVKRASTRKRKTKLKFGSPAWRKKYLTKRRRK